MLCNSTNMQTGSLGLEWLILQIVQNLVGRLGKGRQELHGLEVGW